MGASKQPNPLPPAGAVKPAPPPPPPKADKTFWDEINNLRSKFIGNYAMWKSQRQQSKG